MLEMVIESPLDEIKAAILELKDDVDRSKVEPLDLIVEPMGDELESEKPKFNLLDTLKNVVLESYRKLEQFVEDVKEVYNSVKGYVDEEYNSPYKKEAEVVEKVAVDYEEVVEIQKEAKQASVMGCGHKLWGYYEWLDYETWKMTAEAGQLQEEYLKIQSGNILIPGHPCKCVRRKRQFRSMIE